MSTDIVHVRWAGNRQMVGWDSAGHGIVMDAPAGYKGEGTGGRPLEVFLEALAGCTAMDVVSVLEKKRQRFTSLEIEVTAQQQEDEFPKIYTEIELVYVVRGRAVSPAAVARAVELSETKYCSVKGMLGPQVNVTTSYRVEEDVVTLTCGPSMPLTEQYLVSDNSTARATATAAGGGRGPQTSSYLSVNLGISYSHLLTSDFNLEAGESLALLLQHRNHVISGQPASASRNTSSGRPPVPSPL